MNRRAFFKALIAAPVAAKAVALADLPSDGYPIIYGECLDVEPIVSNYIDYDYSAINTALQSWHDVRHFELECGTIVCANWRIVNDS